MASKDLKNNIKVVSGLNIASITTNTTTVPANGVDTLGYESVTIVVMTGVRTDGTVTPLLQECDTSDGVYTDVSDNDLIGLEASAALSTAQSYKRFGYIGSKRYLKPALVSTSVTTGLTAGTCVILGDPKSAPVA